MNFPEEARGLLNQIPEGRVATDLVLAEALGDARAAGALREFLLEERPAGAHRVVKRDGRPFDPESLQLLLDEGVDSTEGRVRGFNELLFDSFQTHHPLSKLREEQLAEAPSVVIEDGIEERRSIAGFDVTYRGQEAFAAAVLMDWKGEEVLEETTTTTRVTFPYIPSYLAYREFEAVRQCYEELGDPPSLLLFDGQGTLHPAGYGLACMGGVRLGKPSVGVAKSLLWGVVELDPGPGQASAIRVHGRVVGYCFRPKIGRPLYVSPGHLVTPRSALSIVRNLCQNRLPEPLRRAHQASFRLARESGDY